MAYYNPYYNPSYLSYRSPFELDREQYSKDAMIRRIPKPVATSEQPSQGNSVNAMGIAQGAVGAADMVSDWAGMANEANSIQTNAPSEQLDAYGRPVFNLGEFAGAASSIKPKGATGGEVLGSTAKGAAAGTSIMPGIGTAIGAVVGAVGGLIGGGVRKRRMRRAKQRAINSIRTRQRSYNTGIQSYNTQQRAMDEYNRNRDTSTRLYNIYNS